MALNQNMNTNQKANVAIANLVTQFKIDIISVETITNGIFFLVFIFSCFALNDLATIKC